MFGADIALGFALGFLACAYWPERWTLQQPMPGLILCGLGIHRWRPESYFTCNGRDKGIVCTRCGKAPVAPITGE